MARVYRVRSKADHRPKASWDDEWTFSPDLVVFEPDGSPRATGLCDHLGNDIVAVDEIDPIGYVRLKDSK